MGVVSRRRSVLSFAAAVAVSIVVGGASSSRAAVESEIVFAANDAPATSGEIYAVTLGGRQIDLTKSPALDDAPAVSPNGKTVAFMSIRSGKIAAYTVRIDGTGLKRVSPFLGPFPAVRLFTSESIAWSPNGRQLAVQLFNIRTGRVYVVDAGGAGWHAVSSSKETVLNPASWSPDGQRLLYVAGSTTGSSVRVVSTGGGTSWGVRGVSASWSASGQLAVETTKKRLAVYDASGRRLASFDGTWAAWSPNGDELAVLTTSGALSVRASGTGPAKPLGTFDIGLQDQSHDALEWVGNETVAVSNGFTWHAVAPVTGRVVTLPHLFAQGNSVLSADGREAAIAASSTTMSTLEVQGRGARRPTIVQQHAACGFESPYDEIQLVPGGHSLVYESACTDPPGSLFAIAPDGSGLHRLTEPSLDANQPSLSPDRSTLAFVERAPATCLTCGDSIWLARSDGSDPHQLVATTQKPTVLFDDNPSFSPDGSEVLFAQSSNPPGGVILFPNNSELFEAPVAGGQPTSMALPGSSPAWGPELIAYTNGKGEIAIAHQDGTNSQVLGQGGQSVYGTPAWSADGRLAVLGTSGTAAWIVLSSGQAINLPRLQLDPSGGGLAWSPDGSQIAFIADDNQGIGDLWVVNTDGTDLRRLTHDVGASLGVTWR